MMWKAEWTLCKDAHAAELRATAPAQLLARCLVQLLERLGQRCLQVAGCDLVVVLRAAVRLGDDRVYDAELQAVERVRLERRRGLLRLAGVAPENRSAALGRDHGVDRVLLHEDAIGDGNGDGAAGAALPDDAGDGRDRQARHCRL